MAVVYQPAAKGITLARNIDFLQARSKFGDRLLSPDEIQKFAKAHPWRFKLIMRKMGVKSGTLSLVSDVPLRELLKNGCLRAEAANWNEHHAIAIPQGALERAGIDLDMPNPFLLINSGYFIAQSGEKLFSITISPQSAGMPGQFSLYSHNGKKPLSGWHVPIGGLPIPSGAASDRSNRRAMFCFERDDLLYSGARPLGQVRMGAVRRGAGLCDGGRRSVAIGTTFLGACGVLFKDESATRFAAFKETLKQTWKWLKEGGMFEFGY